MKLVCSLLFLSLFLFSCDNNDNNDNDDFNHDSHSKTAVVKGNILNHDSTSVFRKGDFFEGKDTLNVGDQGGFFYSFDLISPKFVPFTYNNTELMFFIAPGDTLGFNLDADSLKVSDFVGRHEEENRLLNEKNNFFKDVTFYEASFDSVFSLEPNDFEVYYEEVKEAYNLYFESMRNDELLNTDFVDLAITLGKMDMASDLFRYPMFYNYYKEKEADLSENYYDFIDDIKVDQPSFTDITSYSFYTEMLLNYKLDLAEEKDTTIKNDDEKRFATKLLLIKDLFSDENVLSMVTFNALNRHLSNSAKGITDELISEATDLILYEDKVDKINEAYTKWKKLEPGKKAPIFTGEYIDETPFSSEDLLGKYIYVDVWATWCGPCVAEIPKLEELQNEFKDKNIAFVSISIDMKYDAWKEKVERDNLKGIQVAARTDEKIDQILEDYNISGIPRFMLIDPEGNIVDTNAPRPSGNIIEVLNELDL
jgi:thiol-disulfide isomerase/thioredoxin